MNSNTILKLTLIHAERSAIRLLNHLFDLHGIEDNLNITLISYTIRTTHLSIFKNISMRLTYLSDNTITNFELIIFNAIQLLLQLILDK